MVPPPSSILSPLVPLPVRGTQTGRGERKKSTSRRIAQFNSVVLLRREPSFDTAHDHGSVKYVCVPRIKD